MDEKKTKPKSVEDDILNIVEKFIFHFETVEKKIKNKKEDENNEYSS